MELRSSCDRVSRLNLVVVVTILEARDRRDAAVESSMGSRVALELAIGEQVGFGYIMKVLRSSEHLGHTSFAYQQLMHSQDAVWSPRHECLSRCRSIKHSGREETLGNSLTH